MKKLFRNGYLIGLDIGGTTIKSSIIDIDNPTSKICDEFFTSFEIDSLSLSYDEIMRYFVSIFNHMYQTANDHNLPICGIGIATPGPFDHEKGISLIKHKYKPLFGVNLKEIFRKLLDKPAEYPIFFDDDCRAFLLGEALYGEAKEFSRCIGITIGTGLGAGFMVEKNFLREGKDIPNRGQLWSLPYENGILEDLVSKRGIINLYLEYTGSNNAKIDVKDIADLAFAGDERARKVFMEMGKTLGEILKPIAEDFAAECVIFGGNISRSYLLFADSLNEELKTLPCLKKVAQAASIDLSVFYALAYEYTKLARRTIDEKDWTVN